MTRIGNVGVMRRKNKDRSITYYLRWYETDTNGRRRQRTLRAFKTEAAPTRASRKEWDRLAHVRAYEHQRELESLDAGERRPTRMGLRDAYIDYVEYCYTKYTRGAYEAKQRVVEGFVRFVAEEDPDVRCVHHLSHRHLAEWRHARSAEVKDTTLAAECSHLQSFLNWCCEMEFTMHRLTVLPRAERRRMDLDTTPEKFLTTDKLVQILRSQKAPLRRICLTVLAGTGMRSGELKSIRVGWWKPGERLITIPKRGPERNKKHARQIPVGPHVAAQINEPIRLRELTDSEALLFAQPNGRPLTTHLNHWLKPYGHSPHDLRRWFISTLLDLGCPAEIRHDLAGHTKTKRDAAYERGTPLTLRTKWAERVDSILKGC